MTIFKICQSGDRGRDNCHEIWLTICSELMKSVLLRVKSVLHVLYRGRLLLRYIWQHFIVLPIQRKQIIL